ncbi:MAG TPA: superoxide dismutase, partial [Flavobacterium sp.]|nr:superoxide dismutase [Flavobacterium sp.]
DAKTMELHYSKHHLGYANKLNEAIKETEFKASNIEEILKNLESENQILRNNAGAYYNHNLFFETLTKEKKTKPSHIFLAAIETQFGSLDALKNEISNQANHLVGSGWVWIVLDSNKQLQVITTQNHDNPLLTDATVKGIPIFVIDLWEHAYYLKYNNSKKNYLENILNIIDWGMVSKRYENQLTLE